LNGKKAKATLAYANAVSTSTVGSRD